MNKENKRIEKVFIEPAPKGLNLWTDEDMLGKKHPGPSFILNANLDWN